MSTAAPVLEVGPSKPGPSTLAPERRERLLFARMMILLIVPLYVLILLTLKDDARRWLRSLDDAQRLVHGEGSIELVPLSRRAYHGLIAIVCVATPLYCLLGLARLALGRAGWKHVLAAAIGVLVGIGEAVAIAIAVFRYHAEL
jgi:hypothetical protein